MKYQVYTATDAAGAILYIGYTRNYDERMTQHRSTSLWYPLAATITTEEFPSEQEARRHERQRIKAVQPPYNIVHTVRGLAPLITEDAAMSDNRFVCPYCDRRHRTLRAVLSCHPAETRRATARLGTQFDVIALFSGINAKRKAYLFGTALA